MTRLLSICVAAAALSGCCNGPFVAVDCLGNAVLIDTVNAQGKPASADRAEFSVDGGRSQEAHCWSGDTGGVGGCDRFFIQANEEGLYTIELFSEGQIVATETVEVVHPRKTPGECCSGSFYEERTVELPSA